MKRKINKRIIGKRVHVTVDRPLGTYHPEHPDLYYPINYGYIEGIMAPDGEEQDAYILGVNEEVASFDGEVIAIVKRRNDNEDKWVVAPSGTNYSIGEIYQQVSFQEQYYDVEIIQKSSAIAILKTYYAWLIFPLLYIPYRVLNSLVLVKIFGCPCSNPDFNANDITELFWLIIGALTLGLVAYQYPKVWHLKSKKAIIGYIISLFLTLLYGAFVAYQFTSIMFWN